MGWHKGLQNLWSHPILQSPTAEVCIKEEMWLCLVKKGGKEYVNPIRSYCYESVVQSLEGLVKTWIWREM